MAVADRTAVEEFGMETQVLMEHAGTRVAELVRRQLGGAEGRSVLCLIGKGNNGGDGLVAARVLADWGARVSVVLGGAEAELRELPAAQLKKVRRLGIVVSDWTEAPFGDSEVLVDALLGYNSKGDPRGPVAGLIRRANGSGVPVIAVDVPSGLDSTTGIAGTPCTVARATVTFGWPKTGFLNPAARHFLGELYVADILFPQGVYARYSDDRGLFAADALVRVW